uniref:Ensconsin-like n=1 Tax=Cyprinus carpio TaxID=7962 RepID=A0A8C1L0X8_CYPCA
MAERDGSDVCQSSSQDSDYLLRADEKSSWSRPDSSASGQYTYTIPSPTDIHIITRPEPLTLKIDERQRLARERREELEKQNAARGSKWMEREERARQFHERQLEERRKKLEEQRDKEERRRAAVEEKRRQKLEEEKVRYEAVIRRTMERSQRVRPKSNRWSWGGTLPASTSHNSGKHTHTHTHTCAQNDQCDSEKIKNTPTSNNVACCIEVGYNILCRSVCTSNFCLDDNKTEEKISNTGNILNTIQLLTSAIKLLFSVM